MEILKQVNDGLYRVLKALMMLLLCVIAALVFVGVIARAVSTSQSFSLSLPWTEEMSIYCFSWLTYFGAAVVLRNNDHIAISSFVNLIRNPMAKRLMVALGQVIILAFTITTVWLTSRMVMQFYLNDLRATNLQWLKMAFVFLQVPVSSAIYSLFMVEKIVHTFTEKEATQAW